MAGIVFVRTRFATVFGAGRWLLAAVVACCALTASEASAQYVVTETTDDGTGAVAGTLSNAILQANATGGTITFNLNGGATTINLSGSMYGISAAAPITIDGGAGITINANGFQAFTVNSGNVNFEDLTINGSRAQGQNGGDGNGGGGGGLGAGGAIYVDPVAGSISVQNVIFTNNQAAGGAGGMGDGASANGGDGGGYNGNAGPNTAPSGTGGGPGAVGAGDGSPGGYGGGGGGGSTGATTVAAGNGGGSGGLSGQGGNGGLGLGGALFIGNGNTTTIRGGTVIDASNSAIGGNGGTGTTTNGLNGTGTGGGLYVGIGSSAVFNNSAGDITISGDIYSNGHITITGTGGGTVNFFGTTVTTTTGVGITVATGTLNGNSDSIVGLITNSSTVRFTQATTGTFNGGMQGSGRVIVGGGGTLIFTNTNVYSGGTTVESGTILQGSTLGVQGNVLNNSVVNFDQNTTGTYSGVMTGTGSVLLTGGGTYVFTGTNTYSGGTTVDAGNILQGNSRSLQGGIQNDSSVIFDQSFSGTYGGVMSGIGAVTKSGTGTLNFTGANTYSGPTTIDGGKLSVNGSVTSDVFINSGGALGGTGTITGNLTNDGILAPGNSIGTIHQSGTFTSNPGSTTQIEINNGGTVAGVNNDLIDVTGDAVINGGTVEVITTTTVGFGGNRYRFLQATTSLTGTFDGISINTPFLDATLEYDYNLFFVDFLLTRSATSYASVAQTENQRQVATYLDAINPTANGDLGTVLDQLNLQTAAGARSAFDQMSGFAAPSAASLKMLLGNFMFQKIVTNSGFEGDIGSPRDMYGQPYGAVDAGATDVVLVGYRSDADVVPVYRINNRRRHTWNSWTTGYGSFASGGNIVGDYAAAGNITSLYRYLNDIVKFGVFGAYNYVNVGTDAPNQSARTDDYQFGSYLRADDGVGYALLAYSAGVDNIRTYRNIQFGAINRTALGNTDGWQNTVYTEIGRRIPVYPMDVQPFLGLQYTYLRQNGYQETGADSLNLNAGGIDGNALYGLLGSRFLFDGFGGTWDFHTAWLHNYLNPSTVMSSTFVGAGGGGFTTRGFDLGNDAALIGAGANWNATRSLSLSLNYDAYIANNTTFSYGSGSIQYRW